MTERKRRGKGRTGGRDKISCQEVGRYMYRTLQVGRMRERMRRREGKGRGREEEGKRRDNHTNHVE